MTDMLSEREHQVARLYTDGQSYKQIGRSLGISPATVRTHLNAIYRKLDVSNKVELISTIANNTVYFMDYEVRSPDTVHELPIVCLCRPTLYSNEEETQLAAEIILSELKVDLVRFKELRIVSTDGQCFPGQEHAGIIRAGMAGCRRYVAQSSARSIGHHLRISVLLIDVDTGVHVWAERYDQPRNGYGVPDMDLPARIAVEIAARVIDDNATAGGDRRPSGLRAYDLFAQALRISDRLTPADQERALQLFERARTLDPNFARAYTGLAFNYLLRNNWYHIYPPTRIDPDQVEALRYAELAHACAPSDPRVHYTLGYTYLVLHRFDQARRHLSLAQVMNPNDPGIQAVCAFAFACLGDPDAGAAATERVLRLSSWDPPSFTHYRSRVAFVARRYPEAVEYLERSISGMPQNHPRDCAYLATVYARLRRHGEARHFAEFFLSSVQSRWTGKPSDGPPEYVEWLVQASYLRRPEDVEHLREGLRLAGLPA